LPIEYRQLSKWIPQGLHLTAYSPLGTPDSSSMMGNKDKKQLMEDPVVTELAKKYNKNVGQVLSCLFCMQGPWKEKDNNPPPLLLLDRLAGKAPNYPPLFLTHNHHALCLADAVPLCHAAQQQCTVCDRSTLLDERREMPVPQNALPGH